MRLRRVIIFSGVAAAALVLALYIVAQSAVGTMRGRIVAIADTPVVDAVIVPGASVLPSGKPSDVLSDRLLTAIDIYTAKKATKILVSGDHGTRGYDEVNTMRVYLLDAGIPADDIFLDHAGFDTYDTMYRARTVYGIDTAIVATQTFHLPRALYIGNRLGIDAYGVAAERQQYVKDDVFAMRERFANVKAYLDLLRHASPTYTGTAIDISGDGRVTWDSTTNEQGD